jgi:hypothetical protein
MTENEEPRYVPLVMGGTYKIKLDTDYWTLVRADLDKGIVRLYPMIQDVTGGTKYWEGSIGTFQEVFNFEKEPKQPWDPNAFRTCRVCAHYLPDSDPDRKSGLCNCPDPPVPIWRCVITRKEQDRLVWENTTGCKTFKAVGE